MIFTFYRLLTHPLRKVMTGSPFTPGGLPHILILSIQGVVFDRPGGRWPVRLLGTRGEARPAGWSLHRTGMRAGHARGFTIIRVMAYLPESLFRGSRQGLSLL